MTKRSDRRTLNRCTRKLVDISDNDGKGPENTIWFCREIQKRGVESLVVQYYDAEPGFHRIFVHVRYLELAKTILQAIGTKPPQEAVHAR